MKRLNSFSGDQLSRCVGLRAKLGQHDCSAAAADDFSRTKRFRIERTQKNHRSTQTGRSRCRADRQQTSSTGVDRFSRLVSVGWWIFVGQKEGRERAQEVRLAATFLFKGVFVETQFGEIERRVDAKQRIAFRRRRLRGRQKISVEGCRTSGPTDIRRIRIRLRISAEGKSIVVGSGRSEIEPRNCRRSETETQRKGFATHRNKVTFLVCCYLCYLKK